MLYPIEGFTEIHTDMNSSVLCMCFKIYVKDRTVSEMSLPGILYAYVLETNFPITVLSLFAKSFVNIL